MDPPVWTTARYPPLHDLTPLLKTLLQFGLHLPLPACPLRASLFSLEDNYSSGKSADHTCQEESGLRPSTVAQRLPVSLEENCSSGKSADHTGQEKSGLCPCTHTALATTVSRKVGFARRRNSLATTWPRKLENLFFQAPAFLFLKKLDSFWKPLAQALHVALPVHLFTTSLQASCVGLAGLLPAPVGSAS